MLMVSIFCFDLKFMMCKRFINHCMHVFVSVANNFKTCRFFSEISICRVHFFKRFVHRYFIRKKLIRSEHLTGLKFICKPLISFFRPSRKTIVFIINSNSRCSLQTRLFQILQLLKLPRHRRQLSAYISI